MFRETLEAAIIISVLLALVEQLVKGGSVGGRRTASRDDQDTSKEYSQGALTTESELNGETTQGTGSPLLSDDFQRKRRLLRKLRIQIFAGAGVGLLLALAIGAAFIAVYYTKLQDLYGNSEELWEGIFAVIAAIMICEAFVMLNLRDACFN